ncbi:MAG TPA: class I SAM-dependent methyltransferase [Pirellulaceae bacterium]|nr:class I SAM-dependent methyltransferase [Pirellulaceae bacterium]HMO92788.1 class I SAM-dependent methyltransferase [Pirellulaceae bacterium]HMP69370.1 class I SAM-dependent methyltransferase [Pirellulaceae bacterium]
MIQKFILPNQRVRKIEVRDILRNGRVDNPHVLVPSAHIDVNNSSMISRFLDDANQGLICAEEDDPSIGMWLRRIYGVTHSCRSASPEIWNETTKLCRQHGIFQTLHEDPFVRRAYEKPRGYPGDAVLLDYIYDQDLAKPLNSASPLGTRIHRWTTQSSACNGVKSRRAFIAAFIDRLVSERPSVEIMSVACGHFREADISSAILRRKLKRIVGVDSDAASLALVDEVYGRLNIETIETQARRMLTGRIDFGKFDFIFSAGLFDYLSDQNCRQLCSRWFSMLKPGGFLLLTNFFDNIEGVGFMEAFMDWRLIYRNRLQMMAMTMDIPEEQILDIHYFAEENQNVIFILLQNVW